MVNVLSRSIFTSALKCGAKLCEPTRFASSPLKKARSGLARKKATIFVLVLLSYFSFLLFPFSFNLFKSYEEFLFQVLIKGLHICLVVVVNTPPILWISHISSFLSTPWRIDNQVDKPCFYTEQVLDNFHHSSYCLAYPQLIHRLSRDLSTTLFLITKIA